MTKIIISGIAGRMGSAIAKLAAADPETEIIGGLEIPGHPEYGSDLEPLIDKANVLIEFTNPETTLAHLKIARTHKCAVVIGTTGFTPKQLREIDKLSKDIACVISPNMSPGVNLMFDLVAQISKQLPPGYDIELIESHHHHKKDAPSGTAKKIAENICQATGLDINKNSTYGRQGLTGPRPAKQLGIHVIRAGDIVGEHTILWAGPGEVLELTHKALSRDTFASGALRAAKFAVTAKPGKYNMQDVLQNR